MLEKNDAEKNFSPVENHQGDLREYPHQMIAQSDNVKYGYIGLLFYC